jgi:DNA-binding Lrp family transcriptional regulator
MVLKEEQLRVLKTLIEATSRMDLNMFAQKVNLTPDETIRLIQELAKDGFLQKVGGGYGVTKKGKATLKVFMPVPKDTGFHFYYGIDQSSDFTAESLEQFYRLIKQISAESLEFHLYRGDFENWLKEACKDPELASAFEGVKAADLKGDELRKELLKVLDAKCGIEELL